MERAQVRMMMAAMERAAKQVGELAGLTFHSQSARYSDTEVRFRITLRAPGAVEAARTQPAENFEVLARLVGLEPSVLHQEFSWKGHSYRIDGIKLGRSKYPVSCTRDDGKRFKFGVDLVKLRLEARR